MIRERNRAVGSWTRKRSAALAASLGLAFAAGSWLGPARWAPAAAAEDAPASNSLTRPVIRHLVLIDFKPETTEEQIDGFCAETLAFPGKIDGLEKVEWGADIGMANRADGYDRAIVMTFADKESLANYAEHPVHKALLGRAMPNVDRLLIFDIDGTESAVCVPPAE